VRRGRRPGPRPPWWPESQPWPPTSQRGRRPPGHFIWRAGCLFAFLLMLAAAAVTVAVLATAAALGVIASPAPVRVAAIAVLLLAALAVGLALRGLGRLTRPVAELVEAAGRIEAGDYSARVRERGPRAVRSVARAFNAMSARLEASEARRRSFLADVTHELRTPLAVIRGQAEAIADGVYPADPGHLAPILDAARTLDVLVEDLRTLALSEVGALTLAREPVDLGMLVEEAVEGLRPQAHGIAIGVEMEDDLPPLDADPTRLLGVVGNLVANAIRHTPSGGSITVAARRAGGEVVLSVTDTGEGIPPDLLPRVFDRFVRGPGSRGTGLGLAIVRDVVEAHGGRVEVESEVGRGTTVRVWLAVQSPTG
jgi:two-component system, OmpR family, sensor histidine kinase BaeS